MTTPPFDLSPFVGVWNVTLRLTEVKAEGASGCVAETMQSQMNEPSRYSLAVTTKAVTITNPSGDYACTFTNFKTDSSSFTTAGATGYFTCQTPALAFRCSDGTMHNLWSWGQDITASVSGTEMSGTWGSTFESLPDGGMVNIAAAFKGTR